MKNIAEGSMEVVFIEDGFYVFKIQNDTPNLKQVVREIDSSFIQFHFCLKGNAAMLWRFLKRIPFYCITLRLTYP